MAKVKKMDLPHHVKERLRHQKLQLLFDQVADLVPKPLNEKRESKDTKLRRIILYTKFLQTKGMGVKKKSSSKIGKKISVETSKKITEQAIKVFSLPEKMHRRAQIVFLNKPDFLLKEEKKKFLNMNSKENCYLTKKKKYGKLEIENELSSSTSDISSQNSLDKYKENQMTCSIAEYIPNGIPSQNLVIEESPKMCCSCCDHPFEKGLSNCHTISSNIPSMDAEHMPKANIFQNSPLMSLENNCTNYNKDTQTYSYTTQNSSSSIKKNVGNEQFYFENHPYYFSEHQHETIEPLPPISFFSPMHSVNNTKYNNKNFSAYDCLPMSQLSIKDATKKVDDKSFHYNISTSDHNLLLESSTNLISSQESAFIPSSNEWVSDDTATDSESFARSSSFESPLSINFKHTNATAYQNVPFSEEKTHKYDVYELPCEELCDLKPFQNLETNSNVYGKSKSESQSSLFADLSKTNAASRMYPPRYEPNTEYPYGFGHQQRDFNQKLNYRVEGNLSDDCCVPQCSKEIKLNSEPSHNNFYYQCLSNMPIKKESAEPFLPEKEISYSFKNFSKWCPEKYFDMSL